MNLFRVAGVKSTRRFGWHRLGAAVDCVYDIHMKIQGLCLRVGDSGSRGAKSAPYGYEAQEFIREFR